MKRARPSRPVPRLSVSLALMLCVSAASASPTLAMATTIGSSASRPILQPRDEQALCELLACLQEAARQMTRPAAVAPDRPGIAAAPTFSPTADLPAAPVLRPERGDYRAHLLNLPPPAKA